MPSIAEAVSRNQQRILQGGRTGAVPEGPTAPSPSVAAPPTVFPNMPSRGVWPANLILGSNVANQSKVFQQDAVRSRSFPFPPTPTQVSKTTIVSTTTSTAASTLLETNNVPNPTQNILNLISGSNITLAASPGGAVEISAAGGTDGLIHGDSIWESDPAYIILRDDFTTTYSPATGYLLGQMPWIVASVTFPFFYSQNFGPLPYLGSWGFGNDGTAGDTQIMVPAFGGTTAPWGQGWAVSDKPNWKMIWNFSVNPLVTGASASPWNSLFSFTKVSFYIGLGWPTAAITTGLPPRPPSFIGLRFDTDPTSPAISDTQFVFEAVSNVNTGRSNVQGNTAATGIVPTQNNHYRFEMTCTTPGQVEMTLTDGTTLFSATLTIPKANLSVTFETIGSRQVAGNVYGGFVVNVPNLALPFGAGTNMTVSGITNPTYTPFNGTWPILANYATTTIGDYAAFLFPSAIVQGSTITGDLSFYPALIPWVSFGNDTSASPTADSKAVNIDFFSFVWNPGVGGGTGTPNPLKPRYF